MTNSADDFLIDGLSFKLPPGASYVTDRKIQPSTVLALTLILQKGVLSC